MLKLLKVRFGIFIHNTFVNLLQSFVNRTKKVIKTFVVLLVSLMMTLFMVIEIVRCLLK